MKIMILGCGWLGKIYAAHLLQQGHSVHGTATSPEGLAELENRGIAGFCLDLSNETSVLLDGIPKGQFDQLLISIPVKRSDQLADVRTKFNRLVPIVGHIPHHSLVFLGSTGIYPHAPLPIHEDSLPDGKLDQRLLLPQQILSWHFPHLTTLRLGGLFGPGRIPCRHFGGKPFRIGSETANYIHGYDVCAILQLLASKSIHGKVYNAVCPGHPTKKEVLLKMMERYGIAPPSEITETKQAPGKYILGDKLVEELGYRFIYPSPLDF